MPILAHEAPALEQAGFAAEEARRKRDADLKNLILGHQQAKEMAIQKNGFDVAGDARKFDYEGQGQQRNVGAATALQATQPKGTTIGMSNSGVTMNPPDPLSNFLKQSALSDKDDNQSRQETQALQAEFKKLGGNDPEKLASFDNISSMLDDVNVNNVGSLRAQLARGVEKGVLTDQDIARYLPSSLMGDAKKLGAYMTGGIVGSDEFGQVVTPEQKTQIKADILAKRKNIVDMQGRATQELSGRAPLLAPTLNRNGSLKQAVDSLGGVARSAASGGLDPEKARRLAELRAKKAARGAE